MSCLPSGRPFAFAGLLPGGSPNTLSYIGISRTLQAALVRFGGNSCAGPLQLIPDRADSNMAKTNRRQHFIARLYIRNFTEPIFTGKVSVYDLHKQRWESRSPEGVGWRPYLCSMIDMNGKRTDEFDRFLRKAVEEPAAPVLRRLAKGDLNLGAADRAVVALFVALTAARSPALMDNVLKAHLDGLSGSDREELEAVSLWSHLTGTPLTEKAARSF
jgi:hypothetical protein